MKKNKSILILFLIFFSFNPLKLFADDQSVSEINENDFYIGDLSAPITIIEYASMSCGHCANFHIDTLPIIIDEYVNKGLIKIAFRDFPFNHPALMGSMLISCLSNDIRLQYSHALYKFQSNWVNSDSEKSKNELFKIMQIGGMNKKQFDKCLNDKDIENKILIGIQDAQSEFNINSTPSFIINGKLIEGNKSIEFFRDYFEKIIDTE
tara:strand:+ start:8720 stop:9343 length:624 start_codon:yes stop_codon:yes gene_type:complete